MCDLQFFKAIILNYLSIELNPTGITCMPYGQESRWDYRICGGYRGYYKAARIYEISLRVLKNISRVRVENE